jgi:hypothetical protein
MLDDPYQHPTDPPQSGQPANLGFLEMLAKDWWDRGLYTRAMRLQEAVDELKIARGI